jgi:hypothetical protein
MGRIDTERPTGGVTASGRANVMVESKKMECIGKKKNQPIRSTTVIYRRPHPAVFPGSRSIRLDKRSSEDSTMKITRYVVLVGINLMQMTHKTTKNAPSNAQWYITAEGTT